MAQATTLPARPKRRGPGALVFVVIVLIVAIVGAVVVAGFFAAPGEPVGATVSVVSSQLDAQRAGAGFQPAIDGEVLATGDVVRTNASGRGFLTFFDGSTAEVEPNAHLAVTEVRRGGDGSVLVRVEQTLGRAWFSVAKFTNPSSRFEVKTPSQTAIVRGTAFEIIVAQDGATTVKTADGEVVVQAQGVQQTVPAGQETTTPVGQPPPPPIVSPPTPGLRFASTAGTGIIVTDPRKLSCGSGRAEIPRCKEGSVTIGDVVPGEYVVLMTAAQAVQATLTLESLFGDQKVSSAETRRAMERGDLVRTTMRVGIQDNKPTLAQFTPFELMTSVCGADGVGRIFSSGTFEERLKALQGYAKTSKGQPTAIIYSDAELTAAAKDAVKQLKNIPAQLSDVKVSVSPGGLKFGASVAAGPLTVPGNADIIAGAAEGKLVMKVKGLSLGPLPQPAVDQFKAQLERNLSAISKDVPLVVDRVSFRAGCLGVIGKTK